MVVKYYLFSLCIKFYKDPCINARAGVVNARTRDKTCTLFRSTHPKDTLWLHLLSGSLKGPYYIDGGIYRQGLKISLPSTSSNFLAKHMIFANWNWKKYQSLFSKIDQNWLKYQPMRTSKIQNGRQGAPKWSMGSQKGLPIGFWALRSTFPK